MKSGALFVVILFCFNAQVIARASNPCIEALSLNKLGYKEISNYQFSNPEEEVLVTSAYKLRDYVDEHPDFDPSTTQLDFLRPLVESIRVHATSAVTPETLASRRDLRSLNLRFDGLQSVLAEINHHLEDSDFTYFWILSLPFRVSFFLDMTHDDVLSKHVRPFFKVPAVDVYKDFGLYSQYILARREFRSTRYSVNQPLLKLGGFGTLSRNSINHTTARRVWPLNMVKELSNADHFWLGPSLFTAHDDDHADFVAHKYPQYGTVPYEVVNKIEALVLDRLDHLDIPTDVYERLVLFHFEIFHEINEPFFIWDKDGRKTTKLTRRGVKIGFNKGILFLADRLHPQFSEGGGEREHRPTSEDYFILLFGAPRLDHQSQMTAIKAAHYDVKLYLQIVNEVISRLDLKSEKVPGTF